MKRISILLILLLQYVLQIFAQSAVNQFIKANENLPYEQKIAEYIHYGTIVGKQNFDDVIKIALQGIIYANEKSDKVSVGILERQIGESYYFKGDYNNAANYLISSVKKFDQLKDLKNLANSYNALAKLYRKTGDLKRSLDNYNKAMQHFETLKDSAGIAMIYNESGVVFEYKGDYAEATKRYNTSLLIDEKRKDTTGICYALSNLAGIYTMQNKFTQAESYLLQSLMFRKKMNDSLSLGLNYTDLGNTYFLSKQYAKAIQFIDTSNVIAQQLGYAELKRNNFALLANIAEAMGDFKTALTYNKIKNNINDTIFSIEKSKQIEELNTRYETDLKEFTINEQRNKIVQQRIILIGTIILVGLGALLAFTQYRRYQWRQEAKLQAERFLQQEFSVKAIIDAEEAERKRIATDLHDGVGQLISAAKMNLSAFENCTTLASADQKVYFERIVSLVEDGCNEIRSVSHNLMPNALLKNNLPEAIHEFLNKLDHKKLKVHFDSDGFTTNISNNIETVLYRVIQECVNNVIKHAQASELDISIFKEQNEITVTIEDNGVGFDVASNMEKDGIGLKNILTRISFLNGTVNFTSEPGKGTCIIIYVPA
ncbi:tetratricopeptide repeat protein [Ferruginibacter yonginensis]|uniref:Oxygen sensor histidine kinase NreB n=1 Tax=Ferruginibacter yonginensis TaxID=1310416 RepID=A0ABV8QQA2_9BACT